MVCQKMGNENPGYLRDITYLFRLIVLRGCSALLSLQL